MKKPDDGRPASSSAVTPSMADDKPTGFGGAIVVRVEGRVSVRMWGTHDPSNLEILNMALAEAISADELDVVVDLADVVFMDGSTVGALAHSLALLAVHDRRLTLQSPTRSSRRLLELCELTDLIEPAPAAQAAQERGAATPLETWVEIPRTPRPASSAAPVEADVAGVDPARSRR